MLRCKSSNLCLWSNHFELEERFKNAFNFLWCNEIKFYQQSKKCKVLKMCKEKGGWLSKVNKNEFSYDIFVSFEKVFLMTLKVSTNKFLLLIRFALCTWNLVLQFKKFKPRDFRNNPCDKYKILLTKNEFSLGNITSCLDVVRLS